MRSVLIALSLLTPLAFGQSFDCKFAQSQRQKLICADTRLSALDAEIAANYKSLRAQLSPASAALVQSDQNEWLRWTGLVCPEHGKGVAADQTRCLTNQYFTRAHDFTITARLANTIVFPRAHFLFKPGIATSTDPVDPGFGYGSLRWPQIDIKPDIKPDHLNAAQSAFNAAVKTAAAKHAVDFMKEKSASDATATFDTSVAALGSIDAYFTIEAANDRLIAITFTDGVYHWGAAHPTADNNSFLWWLDRNRELTAADVFLPNSGWQQKLVPLAIASLNSNTNIKNMLWKGDQMTKPVQQFVPNPRNWTITRDGLTITFGQYSVGPYVIGMPHAHIPWSQLTSMLAPTLNPSTLPAPIPQQNP